MKRVLFIDDEPFVLKVIERKFLPTNIKCYFTTSAKEGLEILERNDIDVVVTDIQMPEMDGITLAKAIQKVSPRTVRILLSGTARAASIIDAINEGHVYKYIEKPWTVDDSAIKVIENAIDVSKRFEPKNLGFMVDIEDIQKFKSYKDWVLTDSLGKVLYQNTDYPLCEDLTQMKYEIINSSKGTLRLYELGR